MKSSYTYFTRLLILLLLATTARTAFAQNGKFINLKTGKFITGDQPEWKSPNFDDTQWKAAQIGEVWQTQGFPDYHGYAWYRIKVVIPSSLKKEAYWRDSLRIHLAHVNDADETFLNGKLIGKTGAFPTDKGGYQSKWPAVRNYHVAANSDIIKWDKENVIVVRVYDGGGSGGIFMGQPFIDMLEKFDGIRFNQQAIKFLTGKKGVRKLQLQNSFNTTITGVFKYSIIDDVTGKAIENKQFQVKLAPLSDKLFSVVFPHREGIKLQYSFTEKVSGKKAAFAEIAPYILTPQEKLTPVINGPALVGVHPGSPVIIRIPVSGARPLTYKVSNLPDGLTLDKTTGIITGQLTKAGDYKLQIQVSNQYGNNKGTFTIKAGDRIALTPPMGWNSWNCWGLNVSEEKVKSSANAMIDKRLTDYGWSYINVDDGWQAPARATDGEILPNEKFPDMKALGDELHNEGLRFGIYSSPGAKTCGGYLGSLGHEVQDMATYFKWGVDYLKYDLCSYTDNTAGDTTLFAQQKPYQLMGNELKKYPRDIIYSICQYGIGDVWKWGRQMNGNLWRTTEDITDTWESLYSIGFSQVNNAKYAGPGGWNDPDMLILGMVGWGENLHQTGLTPYEQYTHISLWSLLSAPLLIGCDMSKLDDFTLNLLKNREVIAIDQDELGKQAERVFDNGKFQVWVKPLADGGTGVGIFNLNSKFATYTFNPADLKIKNISSMRDVWNQQAISYNGKSIMFNIPPHGVRLIKLK
ncbi:hypothetical protein GCM10023149_05560 [Mucilaginibacter gynuensis]|uniref:Alpha-galactosidase n=1 Tax=Mucilaginibacter gynuensis TaxID=1302236 RepID=A0ABP8FTU1_9SPHI